MTTTKTVAKTKKIKILLSDNSKALLGSILVTTIIILILSDPKKYNQSVRDGLNLFFVSVLPGLLPFMFFTKILTGLGTVKTISSCLNKPMHRIFNTSGIASYVFLMSILSGYPIGAKIIEDLFSNNLISESDAKKMSVFCTTSGPIFVVGTIGSIMFGSIKIGIIIFVSHVFTSIMSGIIFRGKHQNHQKFPALIKSNPADNIVANSMLDTTTSILLVGGYITIFFLVTDILSCTGIIDILASPIQKLFDLLSINISAKGIVLSIFEVTRGAKELSLVTNIWSVCFSAAFVSFGGISIVLQSMAYLKKCKIKARSFVFAKCVHSILTFVVCFVLCKLFVF